MVIIGNEYAEVVCELLRKATRSVDIFMYQWNFYPHLSDANVQKLNFEIKYAITRGIKVRALLHGGSASDHLKMINARALGLLTSLGAQVKFFKSGGIMHAKVVLLDQEKAVVGSHNYSRRSLATNVEISAVVVDLADVQRLHNFFEVLWSQS